MTPAAALDHLAAAADKGKGVQLTLLHALPIVVRQTFCAPVAQWIERLVAVQKVVGSIPAGRTISTDRPRVSHHFEDPIPYLPEGWIDDIVDIIDWDCCQPFVRQ